jgi:hypothetical protein
VNTLNHTIESACREQLDRFFAAHPDSTLQKHALIALRLLASAEKPLAGKPEGWTAGIIYAMANLYRRACGIPGPQAGRTSGGTDSHLIRCFYFAPLP